MLEVITSVDHALSRIVRDDPVRPEIAWAVRIRLGPVFVLHNNESVAAAVCCALCNTVPSTVEELVEHVHGPVNTAIFYTIWSYSSGSGSRLLVEACNWLRRNQQQVNQYMTLSPKTEMARRFHLKNGAEIFRTNSSTVNYQYR